MLKLIWNWFGCWYHAERPHDVHQWRHGALDLRRLRRLLHGRRHLVSIIYQTFFAYKLDRPINRRNNFPIYITGQLLGAFKNVWWICQEVHVVWQDLDEGGADDRAAWRPLRPCRHGIYLLKSGCHTLFTHAITEMRCILEKLNYFALFTLITTTVSFSKCNVTKYASTGFSC